MTKLRQHRWTRIIIAITWVVLLAAMPIALRAQDSAAITGTVVDPTGNVLPNAAVTVKTADGAAHKTTSDAQGHFSVSGLAAGRYIVVADVTGFASTVRDNVLVAAGQTQDLSLKLNIASANQQVTVEADSVGSVAAELAPMDALLNATSARTEISQAFINNFTSPIADYGEIVQMAPSTFTTSSDGIGLGQSKTVFRGFPDGDYDIDFDGVPFYDTNTPSHHSWAFFPAQSVGSVDFDRSPGTASTIGPAPFGGSIHLLSHDLSPLQNLRGTFSGGSFNTYLYDLQYDSGSFGPSKKFNSTIDVHHMQSQGYQTFNEQIQNAGDTKLEYKLSDKTTLSGYSGVIWVDANTPNFNATRCQMYGVSSTNAYSCVISGTTLYPSTGAGINFLLTNNSDTMNYLNIAYNNYHVPTDFEYLDVHSKLGKGWVLDFKPYTYNYDNSEKYSNAVPITDNAALLNTTYAPLATKITALCTTPVTKKGVTAIPCGVDKYNSYRKYGETSSISQVSRFGVFNAGMWYEWANTNRHQYPSDPLNNWADQALPNFAEKFVTNSYQPFAEYQWHATSRLTVTPGVKFAYYTVGTQQFADDGKTIGGLGSNSPAAFIANGGSYFATLPSATANYRLRTNWSAYVQYAQGSVVPPSSVFDYNQGTTGNVIPPSVLPRQQKNTTYQFGTVLKFKHVTFDADYFHIHFDNSYSSTLNAQGEPVYFAQPASITQGAEVESNVNFTHGLGAYVNASIDRATYTGSLAVSCIAGSTCTSTTAQITETVPAGRWVQQTPTNIEAAGVTYQHAAWDASFFGKHIGDQQTDNGAYHNQFTIPSFAFANAFINYTMRSGGRFDQTKFRVTLNNIFNSSAVNGISLSNGVISAPVIAANGTTYADQFNTAGQTGISGQDSVNVNAGRSIMLSVTMGFGPKR